MSASFLGFGKGNKVKETKGMSIAELWKPTNWGKGTLMQYTGGQELVRKDHACCYKHLTPNPVRPRSTPDFMSTLGVPSKNCSERK